MCGILGFKGPWTSDDLTTMQAYLRHRGPDDVGAYHSREAAIGLAQTRLSIIDVAGGHQPLFNEDRSVIVVYNGEIYNHLELRRELEAKGHRLNSRSDGEIIAHLYEEQGIGFVQRLRGMFAIALWDARARRLFLIRDRFGIKPLYYRETNRGLLFASEAKAILAVERVRDVDPQALAWYLAFRYVPEDRTLFAGIRKLRPGHWLALDDKGLVERRYWDLRAVEPGPERAEAVWVDELRERLREAVRLRLMSEVPLGAFLSGGLDSSFIVGLMAGTLERPVETFSFGVGSGWHNETEYAQVVARAFGTSHHALHGDCDDLDVLRRVIWHLDEPLADTAVIPTYLLSALTREHVTVALTGEGADELLGGYDKYKVLVLGDRYGRFLPGGLLGALAGPLHAWPKAARGLNFLANAGDRARAYMALVSVFDDRDLRQVLTPDTYQLVSEQEPASAVIRRVLAGCGGPTWLDDLFQIDVHTWLVDDVLLKADKMSMAHGLEARVPFLDHEFAEFCASMPASLKVKGWQEKHALRSAMRGLVPERIIGRRKHGFTVSLKPWANGDDAPLWATLAPDKLKDRGWIDGAAVDWLRRADLDDIYVRRQAFTLMMLELWAETFVDPAVLPAPVPPRCSSTSPAPVREAVSTSG